MSNLEDIKARWAEYNTGTHPADWHIDRGLALAADVGALLAMIDRQQAVLDAARAIDTRCAVRLVGAGLSLDTTPGFHEALQRLHEALGKLDGET